MALRELWVGYELALDPFISDNDRQTDPFTDRNQLRADSRLFFLFESYMIDVSFVLIRVELRFFHFHANVDTSFPRRLRIEEYTQCFLRGNASFSFHRPL